MLNVLTFYNVKYKMLIIFFRLMNLLLKPYKYLLKYTSHDKENDFAKIHYYKTHIFNYKMLQIK
jgi:hypothetical protein